MLIQPRKPEQARIDSFLNQRGQMAFTYEEIGRSADLSAEHSINGYVVDHNRIQLGKGFDCYSRAKEALSTWQMFNLGWVQICWPGGSFNGEPLNSECTVVPASVIPAPVIPAPIQVNTVVGVLANVGLWSLNPCRIVYIRDDILTTNSIGQNTQQFGFGYGTLPGHLAKGEERFQVEWNLSDNSVWYDILAFSQPNHWLSRLGYPVVRQLQKRFAKDSKRAMIWAIEKERETKSR